MLLCAVQIGACLHHTVKHKGCNNHFMQATFACQATETSRSISTATFSAYLVRLFAQAPFEQTQTLFLRQHTTQTRRSKMSCGQPSCDCWLGFSTWCGGLAWGFCHQWAWVLACTLVSCSSSHTCSRYATFRLSSVPCIMLSP